MGPGVEDLIILHKKGASLEEVFAPLDINFLATQGGDSALLFSCLNYLPYEYFSSFLSEKEFIFLFNKNNLSKVHFRQGALREATQDLSERFGQLPEVKAFFQEAKHQIISKLMLYCRPQPFEQDNSNSKKEFFSIMAALSPLFGDGGLDNSLRAYFKKTLSETVSEFQFSELIRLCQIFGIQKQFVDVWSNSVHIPQKFDRRPFKKLRGLICLINKETAGQIGRLMDSEIGWESVENVQHFFLISASDLMKFDCGLLDKPYLQNAIRSLKDQEDKPLVDLPLVTSFLEDGGIDKIPMGFKKHLGDFSLKDLACVEGLMEEFQDKQFAPYFFWDEVREKLSFLKLFDSTQLSEEKWDRVMGFFSEPREERGAWPQGVANDFISWVEKKKLLSVSGDRDISKKVKVKI